MKRIQQYCSVVDRLKQDPSCKQEVLARASRKKISVSRRGMITGTAVAAVLLALNIGGGSYLLKKSAEESMTVTSETPEELVTALVSATTAPGTDLTAVVTKAVTDHSAVTKTVTNRQTNTVTTSYQTVQTGTTVPAETTIARVTDTTVRTTVTTAAVTAVQTTTETTKPDAAAGTPESGKAQRAAFEMCPLGKDYLKAAELGRANNVCYAESGETFMVEIGVRNDPGITNMDLRLTASPELGLSELWAGMEYSEYAKMQQLGSSLYYVNYNPEKQAAKEIASVAIITVTVPENPGRYTIQPDTSYSNGMYLEPDWKSPVGYVFYGLDIIVGADGILPPAAEPFTDQTKRTEPPEGVTDPERPKHHFGDIQFRYETVEAHAGDKSVPVRFYIEKNTGFAGAELSVWECWGLTPTLVSSDLGNNSVRLDESEMYPDTIAYYDSELREIRIASVSGSGVNLETEGLMFTLYFDISESVKPEQMLVFDFYPIQISDTNSIDITERCATVYGGIKIIE